MRLIHLTRAAVVATTIVSAIVAATSAGACSGTDHFLATLESRAIHTDPSYALEIAEAVCSGLGTGEPYDALVEQGVAETGLSHDDFMFVVEQSVLFFCPESTPNLPT